MIDVGGREDARPPCEAGHAKAARGGAGFHAAPTAGATAEVGAAVAVEKACVCSSKPTSGSIAQTRPTLPSSSAKTSALGRSAVPAAQEAVTPSTTSRQVRTDFMEEKKGWPADYCLVGAALAGAVLAFGARGIGSIDAGLNAPRSGRVVCTPVAGTSSWAVQTMPLRT